MLNFFRRLIPKKLFQALQPAYHAFMAGAGAIFYRFPSKRLVVIGVTGTKGKSTTSEILTHILEASGKKVFLSSTIHFKIGGKEVPNLLKMTMPGRFMLQRLMREAVNTGCTHAVVEMSSEGAKLWRHVGTELNGLVVTNLSPEHIESHGSFEKYRAAKLRLVSALNNSHKPNKFLILNEAESELKHFKGAANNSVKIIPFSAATARYTTKLEGHFNLENALAAATAAEAVGVESEVVKAALETFTGARGRLERVDAGQPFTVIVDYAHTADSLKKIYEVFAEQKKICVLGATGGGRDKWKRPEMGKIADQYCEEIILTDDDSYDEDPQSICEEMATGITNHKAQIITDRRVAIRTALEKAENNDVVLITGKGTDPYLMGPNGKKTPWSDAKVAREELNLLKAKDYKL